MHRSFIVVLYASTLFQCRPIEKVDLILINGNIYTLETGIEKTNALAIQHGKILALGTTEDIIKLKGPATKIIDLQNKTVLPGFVDAHIHPVSGGLALMECQLTDLQTKKQIVDSLQSYARQHPQLPWIRGENMWLAAFEDGNPQKKDLDSIFPDRPVYISSSDGHNAWVNSVALDRAQITIETLDPLNGKIERDPISKQPSGTLRESAIDLVKQLLPVYTDKEREQALTHAISLANANGLTTLNEASATPDNIQAYYNLEKTGQLHAHINLSLYADISKGTTEALRVISLRDSLKKISSSINPNQVKLFMDGVVEGKTAAMLDHYANDHHSGIANTSPDTAKTVIALLDRAGMQIHVHAIGDKAVRMTLDAFEYAFFINGKRDARHHIAHLHVVQPDDYPRFKSLDVIANFQALWATWEDSYMTELNQPNLGETRMQWQYPIGSLWKSGAKLAFGSDWDVSTQNPFAAIQVAINRRGPDSIYRIPWTPQHLIERMEVIKGYTVGGAYLTFREGETGSLGIGKWADLIVLDRDVTSCDPFKVYQTKVLMTLFKGQVVHQSEFQPFN